MALLSMKRIAASIVAAAMLWGGTACSPISAPPAGVPSSPTSATSPTAAQDRFSAAVEALEKAYEARVGISVIDGDGEQVLGHRADERLGFASTVKTLIAAVMLRSLSAEERAETVHWTQEDVDRAGYSPVTGQHIGDGMTLDELAEATVRTSDNTAANLIIRRLGGPEAVRSAFAGFGDTTTALTQEEPHLNDLIPGADDNTSTPKTLAADLRLFFAGDALSPESRETLLRWMSGNATGDALIRAGAPRSWSVADKSGGAGGMRNDIAVVTPPGQAPLFVAILTQRDDPTASWDDALVAKTATAALALLAEIRG